MNTKRNIEKLWEYINDTFDKEDVENAIQEFKFDIEKLNSSIMEKFSEEEARSLLFDLSYMTVNELFGGNFHMWNEVLYYNLEFDNDTIDFLNY